MIAQVLTRNMSLLQVIRRMAVVNKVRLPPNMHLQHHESHLLARDADSIKIIELSHLIKPDGDSRDTSMVTIQMAGSSSSSSGSKQHWLQTAKGAMASTGRYAGNS